MKKLFLLLLLAIPLGCQDAGDGGDGNATSAAATADDAATQYVFSVEGMSCALGCPPAVKGALESVPGVSEVVVDYETKKATVKASPDFDQTAAVDALSHAGFSGAVN
jgi:copper chaperone CopZ